MKHGKKWQAGQERVDATATYSLAESVDLVIEGEARGFDETVDITIKLGIDPRRGDQNVRGAVSLPNGTGRSRAVIAFCEPGGESAAIDSGAAEAGGEELAGKIEGGWSDFDVVIAHPSQMKIVGKLGKTLGPMGKMPSPKAGTVVPDVAKAVAEFAAGKVEFRNDDGGILHVPVGKRSFGAGQVVENVEAFLEHVALLRPTSAKGVFMERAWVGSTMGPSVRFKVENQA